MRSIIQYTAPLFLLLLLLGCEEEETFTLAEISPVETLYAPEEGRFFDLGAQGSAAFEWQAAKASDNGVVLYDVAFDVEGGDFSNPIYVVASDGRGFENRLTLSFTELNQIATLAGVEAEDQATLQWTVWSSKGINVTKSGLTRSFAVRRPGGFPTPDQLFLTGSATEGGEEIAEARAFTKTGATTYEIYTSLKPGTYRFITRRDDTAESFYIDGVKFRADGETTQTDDEQVYRIRLDFSDGTVSTSTIDKVELWFPPRGEFPFALNYSGNGTWVADDQPFEFKEESWGRDERYKFRFTVTDSDGNTTEEWYGSRNGDNARPDGNTPADFYELVPVTDDYWANSFKFRTEVDMATIDVRIIFNDSVPEYTHVVTVQ
ncbi:SusE domain-containing protein [Neolewinella sp.]|uniref:SusE domain-containing protein n=1 Tax=Neolewinella sp. TaxID=2993543 RepID=UPI003B52AC19